MFFFVCFLDSATKCFQLDFNPAQQGIKPLTDTKSLASAQNIIFSLNASCRISHITCLNQQHCGMPDGHNCPQSPQP
jgi:hypothetical protein